MIHVFTIHIDDYLTEQHMKQLVNFSEDWKEPVHFCYKLVDMLFFFCVTSGVVVHANHEQVKLSYRKSSKCIIQVCKNSDFKILAPVLVCQTSDDLDHCVIIDWFSTSFCNLIAWMRVPNFIWLAEWSRKSASHDTTVYM